MPLVRIRDVHPLPRFRLRLVLTDGRVIERDVSRLLVGPVFEPIRKDRQQFEKVRVEAGTVVWPNGADLCPDVLIWNGAPPAGEERPKRARSRSNTASSIKHYASREIPHPFLPRGEGAGLRHAVARRSERRREGR